MTNRFLQAAIAAVCVLGGLGIAVFVLKRCLCFCKPNQILVLAGRRQRLPDGRDVGYRVITEGGAFRAPIVEVAQYLDARVIHLRLAVDAYAKGNVIVAIQAVAQVSIAREAPLVHNAVERFLSRDREEMGRVAGDTLEGHLRSLVASEEPVDVHRDRARVAHALAESAEADLSSLGLRLRGLLVDLVMDDDDRLDSIGRETLAGSAGTLHGGRC